MRRFRNKNIKLACFSIEVAVEALRNQLLNDENSLRALFKALSENVGHTNKELRSISIECVREIFRLCTEDAAIFVANLK